MRLFKRWDLILFKIAFIDRNDDACFPRYMDSFVDENRVE